MQTRKRKNEKEMGKKRPWEVLWGGTNGVVCWGEKGTGPLWADILEGSVEGKKPKKHDRFPAPKKGGGRSSEGVKQKRRKGVVDH